MRGTNFKSFDFQVVNMTLNKSGVTVSKTVFPFHQFSSSLLLVRLSFRNLKLVCADREVENR